jgi:mRNA-degrading endonuclease toxin of MazEF toxin-antitoxin module
VNLDHVRTIARNRLEEKITRLDRSKMNEVVHALLVAIGAEELLKSEPS